MVCKAAAPASCRVNLLVDIVHPNSCLKSCAVLLCAQTRSRLFQANFTCALLSGFAGAGLGTREKLQHLLLRLCLQVTVLQCINYQSENGHQLCPSPAAAGPCDTSTARLNDPPWPWQPHLCTVGHLTGLHNLWGNEDPSPGYLLSMITEQLTWRPASFSQRCWWRKRGASLGAHNCGRCVCGSGSTGARRCCVAAHTWHSRASTCEPAWPAPPQRTGRAGPDRGPAVIAGQNPGAELE